MGCYSLYQTCAKSSATNEPCKSPLIYFRLCLVMIFSYLDFYEKYQRKSKLKLIKNLCILKLFNIYINELK